MNGIDWQSYLDGSLSREEMERLSEILRDNPQSQAELKGLESFRAELKARALEGEEVPLTKMKNRLRAALETEVPPTAKHKFGKLGWSLAAAVACLACFATIAYMRRDPLLSNFRGNEVALKANSGEDAKVWLEKSVNIPIPNLSSDKFDLREVRHGADWAAIDVQVDRKMCSVYLKRTPESFASLPHISHGGLSYINVSGIGWKLGDTLYYVTGDDENAKWTVAEEVRRLATLQRPPNPSGKSYNLPPSPHDHRPR